MEWWSRVDARIAAAIRQMRSAIRAAVVRAIWQDGRVMLQLEGVEGETLRDVPLVQHYGFSSMPASGAEAVVLWLGAPGARVVVGTHDQRYRIELSPGEVAIHTDEGDKVHLQRGQIVIESAGTVTVEAPQVKLGEGATQSLVLGDAFKTLYNAHTHPAGIPFTGVPAVPMGTSQLSAQVAVK